jgi:hypothetical protein
MKARIVERTTPDGRKEYVIQQRHWLVHWWWVDAWVNSWLGAACCDYFPTLEEAQRNLCYFDGTPTTERVIPNDKLTGQQKQEIVETTKKRLVTIAGTVRRMFGLIVERIRHTGAAICFNKNPPLSVEHDCPEQQRSIDSEEDSKHNQDAVQP